MCYVITAAGLELLRADDRLASSVDGQSGPSAHYPSSASPREQRPAAPGSSRRPRDRLGARARAGRGRAIDRRCAGRRNPCSRRRCVRRPRAGRRSRPAICDCRAGARPTTSCAPPRLASASRWSASRPCARTRSWSFALRRPDEASARADAAAATGTPAIDLIIEFDDRLPVDRAAGKLERYDHFLAGWSVHTDSLRTPHGGGPGGRVRVPRPGARTGVRKAGGLGAESLPGLRG